MLSPHPISPLDQIRATIKAHENEARHAHEDAESTLARAEQAEASALAHEETAEQWRRILAREERDATEKRLVSVSIVPDIEGYIDGMKRAEEAFISGKPRRRVCKYGDACSDCTNWPKGYTDV